MYLDSSSTNKSIPSSRDSSQHHIPCEAFGMYTSSALDKNAAHQEKVDLDIHTLLKELMNAKSFVGL